MTAKVNRLMVAAAGCGFALVAVVVAAYFVGPIGRADASALQGLRSLSQSHHWIGVINDGLAHSVDLPYTLAILALICSAGLSLGRRRQAFGALLLVAVANVVTQLLKVAAAHPRYQAVLGADQLNASAFPSGHATAVTSLVLAAVLVSPRRLRPSIAVAGGGYALAISIALVIQGWHFPSDVVGAFLVVGGVSMLVLAGLAATEAEMPQGIALEGPKLRLRLMGAVALPAVAALALVAALVVLTHPAALASYTANHTTAVLAAIGIAVASLGLVSSVTAELQASG